MDIHTKIPLKNFTTMRLGGNARFMVEARSKQEVVDICKKAKQHNLPVFVLGGGSNLIVKDSGFDGIVVHMRIPGFEIIADDPNSTTIKIGGGENWDSVVKRTVDMELTGIEAMSLIPGTIGAAPVQNLGSYGQEIADVLVSLEAYDIIEEKEVILQNADCNFFYRDSVFKNEAKNRYIITSVIINLSKNMPQPPFYDTLQRYLDKHNISLYTNDIIRQAVIEIRKEKLPDPKIKPNSGSFFKNAIIEDWQLKDLQKKYPEMPFYEMSDGRFKIPSGWLIEKAGLKGALINGIKVYEKNALVLVNESASSYQDLATARDQIVGQIRDLFRIEIQQEPIELG